MNLRSIDWIWHVRGEVALAPGQSGDDAFDRLGPLFRQTGTSHERTNDTLVFTKKDAAAQDKMSVFDSGVLQIEPVGTDGPGPVLRYQLVSRALLYCFLAPLFFLAIAQMTIAIANHEKAVAAADAKAGKPPKPKKKEVVVPMNPIDKALGAPEPKKPKKDGAKKDGVETDAADEEGGGKKKRSPTPAYVFAGMFAALYLAGRVLEDRLVKSLFRKRLTGQAA